MNFPSTPIVGQQYAWGDFVWVYVGNNKWDLQWVRGRGNLLTWIIAYVEYLGNGIGGTRGTKNFTFDAT